MEVSPPSHQTSNPKRLSSSKNVIGPIQLPLSPSSSTSSGTSRGSSSAKVESRSIVNLDPTSPIRAMTGSLQPFPGSCPVQVIRPSRFITKQVYLLPREPIAYPGSQNYVKYPRGSVVPPKNWAFPCMTKQTEFRKCTPLRNPSPYPTQSSPRSVNSPRVSQEPIRRRARSIFTDSQCHYMKSVFNQNHYLTKETRAHVAKSIGVLEHTVDMWFRNQRSKINHQRKQRERALQQYESSTTMTIELTVFVEKNES